MRVALAAPIALASVVHLALAIGVAPWFEFDSQFYRAQAESLAAGRGSLDTEGRPETRYPPGYPLFLAVFLVSGLGYTGAIAAQHCIWVSLVAAAVWLAWRASGSTVAASAAGVITTLDLPGVQSSMSVVSETLAALTIVAAACCAWLATQARSRSVALGWAVGAGALAGMTALVRPIAIALGLPLAGAVWIGADRLWRLRAAVVLLAVFALPPMVWTVRNARVAGVATLSSLSGINLLLHRAAGTLAIRDPGGIDANLVRRRAELEAAACRQLEAAYGRPCADITWAERSGTYMRMAWPILVRDPLATALQAGRALAMIVFGGSADLIAKLARISESTARLVCLTYTVPLALLAVAGIPYWWSRARALAVVIVLVLAYMFGMALGAEAYSRFRTPVIALYGILAAGGVAAAIDRRAEQAAGHVAT